jgi:putative transposase
MAGRKSEEKVLRWREILRRQADSGVSIREFCATEGVSSPSFYAWRKRLRDSMKGARRAPIRNRRQQSNNGPLFLPVKMLDCAPAIEIIHPLGYRIQLTGEVDPIGLRHVIETLDERGER